VRVSAKADYAVRAAVELAAHEGEGPVKGDAIGRAQAIPVKFLENILAELRVAGIVESRRGAEGGYWLARPAAQVTIAEVMRAVEGPLAAVRGERPSDVTFPGAAAPMQQVWVALRASLRSVLDHVSLADVAADQLPTFVAELVDPPEAWEHPPLRRTPSR
jgi:Rrf2 family protein